MGRVAVGLGALLAVVALDLGAAAACPAHAYAQSMVLIAPTPVSAEPTLSEEERARLLGRTGDELADAPVPLDPASVALELALVTDQRNAIDIRGITALQWIGAIVMIAGGAVAVIGALIGSLAAIAGGDASAPLAFWCGSGGGGVALGGLMVGLAELDGNLQHRRALDARIRLLRDAQPSVRFGARGLTIAF